MEFQIKYRAYTGRDALKVEIGAEFESASFSVKLGAAVRVAFASGAVLSDADLRGADLSGAVKVECVLAIVSRVNGGYQFVLWRAQDGRALITAGCRGPWTVARYREHVAAEYADTNKAAETLRILDFFEATDRATAETVKAAA